MELSRNATDALGDKYKKNNNFLMFLLVALPPPSILGTFFLRRKTNFENPSQLELIFIKCKLFN